MTTRRLVRVVILSLATVLLLAPLAWMWQGSRVGPTYSVMDMGYPDFGGGPMLHQMADGDHAQMPQDERDGVRPRSVADLTPDPNRRPDVRVALTARKEDVSIGGRTVPGFTLNGSTPGPTITAIQGQLVEVRATNASVPDGMTLHWHGVDVPNGMDGVAGVTQDAIKIGETFTYRYVAEDAGTFWYHSHQVSDSQVSGGLFGAIVVRPRRAVPGEVSVVAQAHTYGGIRTINGQPGDLRIAARPGQRVRVRVINTDNGPMPVWASHPYRLLATDGTETPGATLIRNERTVVTAGGRADVGIDLPRDGSAVRVQLGRATAVIMDGGGPDTPAPAEPRTAVDLLRYGSPAPLGFDPAAATRRFEYRIDQRPGFVRGRPGLWWSINGGLYPNVPMFVVREGDIVRMTIVNDSGDVHPMHLHGHHPVVLSRDGVAATGAPWIVDSLDVMPGESYEIAFVADNPGVWMFHCHNLKHAAEGMVAHLMYDGVRTPYRVGGTPANQPE